MLNNQNDSTQLTDRLNDSSHMLSIHNDSTQMLNSQNNSSQLSNSQNNIAQLSNSRYDSTQLPNSQNDSTQLPSSQNDSTQQSDFLEIRMIDKDNKQEKHNIQEVLGNVYDSSAVNNSNYSKDNDDDIGSNDSYVKPFSALIIPSYSNKSEEFFYSKESLKGMNNSKDAKGSDASNDFSGSDNFSEINHPKPTVALPMNINKEGIIINIFSKFIKFI